MKNIFLILFCYIFLGSFLFASPLDDLKSKMDSDKASKLIRKGDYDKAVSLYEKAISKNSNSTELYYNLGSALISRGENQNAIDALNLAKKTFNDKTSDKVKNYIYYNSGIAAIEDKNYKQAINELIEALTYNTKDDNARYALEYARKRDKEENGGGEGENSQNNNSQKNDSENNSENSDNQNGNNNATDLETDKLNEQQKNENNKEESLTEEDIERLLNSLRNLRKEPKNNKDNYGGYIEKDW